MSGLGALIGAAVVLSSGSVRSSTPSSEICWVVKSQSLLFARFGIVFLFWLAYGFTFILNFIVCLFFVLEKISGEDKSNEGLAGIQQRECVGTKRRRFPSLWGAVGRVHGCRSRRSPAGCWLQPFPKPASSGASFLGRPRLCVEPLLAPRPAAVWLGQCGGADGNHVCGWLGHLCHLRVDVVGFGGYRPAARG